MLPDVFVVDGALGRIRTCDLGLTGTRSIQLSYERN